MTHQIQCSGKQPFLTQHVWNPIQSTEFKNQIDDGSKMQEMRADLKINNQSIISPFQRNVPKCYKMLMLNRLPCKWTKHWIALSIASIHPANGRPSIYPSLSFYIFLNPCLWVFFCFYRCILVSWKRPERCSDVNPGAFTRVHENPFLVNYH